MQNYSILLIGQEKPSIHEKIIAQTFKWIGAVWKINVIEIDIEKIDLLDFDIYYSMIVLSISPGKINDNHWEKLSYFYGKVPFVGFYHPVNWSTEKRNGLSLNVIRKIWGITNCIELDEEENINVKSNSGHPYTNNLPKQSIVENPNKCIHANLIISDQTTKLIFNADVTLVCVNGLSIFFGTDVNQLGMVTLKPFLQIIENILFHMDAAPHLSIGAYAAVRVDDLPACTSEYFYLWLNNKSRIKRIVAGFFLLSFFAKKYGREDGIPFKERLFWAGHDFQKSLEFKRFLKLFHKYGAKLEYMITSHLMHYKTKQLMQIEKLMPCTLKMMVAAYEKQQININAHGRSHINEAKYEQSNSVDVREFLELSEEKTREHFEEIITFLNKIFGKKASGFVAPKWGYRPHITKKIGAKYFSYIIDDNLSYLESQMPVMGDKTSEGFVNVWETWRYGMPGIDMADKHIWESYFQTGMPTHFLTHGTRVGEQKSKIAGIIESGSKVGVRWLFLEELVSHIQNYYDIVYVSNKRKGASFQVIINCKTDMLQEIMVVGKYSFETIIIDNNYHSLKIGKNTAWIPKLPKGIHTIDCVYQQNAD